MTYLVIVQKRRDVQIVASYADIKKAEAFAQNSAINGTVESAHVIKSEASFFSSTINRANPDTDTSLSDTVIDPSVELNNSLNPTGEGPEDFKGTKGSDADRPVVTQAEANKLQEADAKPTDKNKAAPKA